MAESGERNGASWQEIRAILHELSESQRETDRRVQETDHRMQETDRRMQETDRRMQETDRQTQETRRQMRETDRRLRKTEELFNSQWGKLIEALVKGDLIALLNRRGIEVHHTMTNLERNFGGRTWEIDILAVNSSEVVAVEVKTTMKVRDVDHFLDTLRNLTELMPEYAGHVAYGAVAYLKADESSDKYAEGQGLFVIRATGSSASITNRQDFRPRTFGSRQSVSAPA